MSDIEKKDIVSEEKTKFTKNDILNALIDFCGLLFVLMVLLVPVFKCSPNYFNSQKSFSLLGDMAFSSQYNGIFEGVNPGNTVLFGFFEFIVIAFAICILIVYAIRLKRDIKKLLGKDNKQYAKKPQKYFRIYLNTLGFIPIILAIRFSAGVFSKSSLILSYMTMLNGISFLGVLALLILMTEGVAIILKKAEENKISENEK